MLFADLDLARSLEATDTVLGVECVKAFAHVRPEIGAEVLPIGGTTAIFAGPDSPLTQVFGLGLYESVSEPDLETLEEFFKTRGAPTNIELCPLADPSLLKLLVSRGYQPIEFTNVLVRRLHPHDTETVDNEKVHVRHLGPDDVELWSRTVAESFAEGQEAPPSFIDIFAAFYHMSTSACFLAEIEGQAAGGGMVSMYQGIASLAATSTLPLFRKRGGQSALISARIAFAAAAGCDLAMVSASPGSVSQRNVERHGFRVVFTRCKFFKAK